MLIVYDSLTGLTKKFALKVSEKSLSVKDHEKISQSNEDILLMTRSFGFGKVPKETSTFMESFSGRVKAVVVSGNKNWGANYGKAGETISQEYGIPLLLKFEGTGFENEVQLVKNFVEEK